MIEPIIAMQVGMYPPVTAQMTAQDVNLWCCHRINDLAPDISLEVITSSVLTDQIERISPTNCPLCPIKTKWLTYMK
jgi:hypothetical protein